MRLSQAIPLAMFVAEGQLEGEVGVPAESHVRAAGARIHTDELVFRQFYDQTAPRLRAYLRRLLGDASLADDLTQEAFYRFLRANEPACFSGDAEPWQRKAYLYRTASSLAADHWRRTQREHRWRLLRPFGSAVTSQTHSEESEAMQLFRRLGLREQTLLWLAYVEGFDHREIAATLGIGEKSVRVLLFRARKKLREIAEKEGSEL